MERAQFKQGHCAQGIICSTRVERVQGVRNFFHATFVPCPGILLRTRPHLTVLEAVGLRCFLQADLPQDPGLRLKHGSAQDDSQPERGGALDLSIRQMFK